MARVGTGSKLIRIEDEAVTLRAPSTADQQEFLAAARRSTELHHPWTQPPLDAAGFRHLLLRSAADNVISLVVDRSDGGLAGMVNINNVVRGGFQNGQLGYYAFVPKAGTGLLTRGLTLAISYAFDQLGLHRLEANIQPGNVRSIRLARRCGLRLEGFSPDYLYIDGAWRDHERWVILSDVWSGVDR